MYLDVCFAGPFEQVPAIIIEICSRHTNGLFRHLWDPPVTLTKTVYRLSQPFEQAPSCTGSSEGALAAQKAHLQLRMKGKGGEYLCL